MSEQQPFFQSGPGLGNQFDGDGLLRAYLQRHVPEAMYRAWEPELQHLGQLAAGDLLEASLRAEAQEPELESFDAWGRRIDHIKVSPAWDELHAFAAREGVVASAYERRYGAHSRLLQFAKLYLYTPSSAFYSCPLAMTDGAARVLELYADPALKDHALRHLTSRDPKVFWTSGQWMTEKQGGSDVGQSGTIARHEGDDRYRLYGVKWFTSATTSQMSMALGRIVEADGRSVPGSRGLSLFYLETREQAGQLNGIRIERLKQKLGSKALPTAELTLDGCLARRIGPEGQGIKLIASLFNITRVYNAITCSSFMRRTLALTRDYAQKRMAFGKRLIDLPLHAETLAEMECRYRAAFALSFQVAALLGKSEAGEASADEEALLRLLTPIAKLYTAKEALAVVSEVLESMGGAGYIENTGIPKWLRDTQVLCIWEGTTNVLSLDMLRAFQKEAAFPVFIRSIDQSLQKITEERWSPFVLRLRSESASLMQLYQALGSSQAEVAEASARDLAFYVARVQIGVGLLEHAVWANKTGKDSLAFPALQRCFEGAWFSQRNWAAYDAVERKRMAEGLS